MKQKLTHYTNKKDKKLLLKGIPKRCLSGFPKQNLSLKPSGIWISVNGSWENWLDGNWESWLKGKVCLKVELAEDINLFVIKSKQQFLNKYKELIGKDFLNLEIIEKFDMNNFHQKLKEHYDGMMLLAEPFYKHRLDINFMYFYSWDCESICVWNIDKIKFKEIKK